MQDMCRCCERYETFSKDRLCIECHKLNCAMWELNSLMVETPNA